MLRGKGAKAKWAAVATAAAATTNYQTAGRWQAASNSSNTEAAASSTVAAVLAAARLALAGRRQAGAHHLGAGDDGPRRARGDGDVGALLQLQRSGGDVASAEHGGPHAEAVQGFLVRVRDDCEGHHQHGDGVGENCVAVRHEGLALAAGCRQHVELPFGHDAVLIDAAVARQPMQLAQL